jgi:hypothetical protein
MYDSKLVQLMRAVLEEAMSGVPPQNATSEMKAYLAECILKAAAQGQTTYESLLAAARASAPAVVLTHPAPVLRRR